MAQQLLFDLPVRAAQGRADFIVTACNSNAVELLDLWPAWPGVAACLVGPARSGKTHLVEVWRQRSGAVVVEGSELTEDRVAELLEERAVAVDNAMEIADEAALFHLFNALKNSGGHLLLSAEEAPARWPLELPDLKSRLSTAVTGTLLPPDDALLRGLLSKLFQDYQVTVKEGVISFIISRIERSFEEITEVSALLNQEAMRRKGPVSIPLVREILERR